MPNWEGIEDASAVASRVWFFRIKETEEWKPLRKVDCQALNRCSENETTTTVYLDGGRLTAFPKEGLVRHNYLEIEYQICSAVWFLREEKSKKEVILAPIFDQTESDTIEAYYQRIVTACSSLGEGLASISNEGVALPDERKVILVRSPLKLILKEKGWFAAQHELQRGYGEYKVEGEEEELLLGSVSHLVFVVHGIGEALFSREHVKVASIVEQMTSTRIAIQKRQATEYKAACQKAKQKGETSPQPPARIEIIPVEWFHHVHDSSSMLMKTLRATTLGTIPALRAIANDVIFDILMYMTPKFCQSVLECVTEQICAHYKTFLQVNEGFQGKCSLIGHSLGSVIVWDLLSVLQQQEQTGSKSKFRAVFIPSQDKVEIGYQAYTDPVNQDGPARQSMADHGTWGPTLTRPMQQTIPFSPEYTIFLGSPLGLFLTLRGSHAVFESLRQEAVLRARESSTLPDEVILQRVPSPFHLPTNYLYNIFHPSDPVAYRIEPLLLSPSIDPDDLPNPEYLTPAGKEIRFHVKARQIADDFQKSLKDQKSSWNALIDTTLTALSTTSLPEAQAESRNQISRETEGSRGPSWPPQFLLGSPLNPKRVDYSFQPGIVENEYLNAVMAHSSYFGNVDFQDFLISLLAKSHRPE